jgi:hypothetical protein
VGPARLTEGPLRGSLFLSLGRENLKKLRSPKTPKTTLLQKGQLQPQTGSAFSNFTQVSAFFNFYRREQVPTFCAPTAVTCTLRSGVCYLYPFVKLCPCPRIEPQWSFLGKLPNFRTPDSRTTRKSEKLPTTAPLRALPFSLSPSPQGLRNQRVRITLSTLPLGFPLCCLCRSAGEGSTAAYRLFRVPPSLAERQPVRVFAAAFFLLKTTPSSFE